MSELTFEKKLTKAGNVNPKYIDLLDDYSDEFDLSRSATFFRILKESNQFNY